MRGRNVAGLHALMRSESNAPETAPLILDVARKPTKGPVTIEEAVTLLRQAPSGQMASAMDRLVRQHLDEVFRRNFGSGFHSD